MGRFGADLCIQLQLQAVSQPNASINWSILINLLTMNWMCPQLTIAVTLIKNCRGMRQLLKQSTDCCVL
jgi:hypothetical protein